MKENISFWPVMENTHTCFHGYQMVCVHTYVAYSDRLQDHAPSRFGRWVCDRETVLRPHICYQKSGLLWQTSVTVLWRQSCRSGCSGSFHTFYLGSNEPYLANGARINQVKQVRSESRLTKCPLLIKLTGISGEKKKKKRTDIIVMHALQCRDRRVLFNVTTHRMEILGGICVFTLADVTDERTINLGESLCSLSALPVKLATNYCQRSKVLHLLLSFLI